MVTTLIALLIRVLAIAIILLGKSRLFDTQWKTLVGCCIVLFADGHNRDMAEHD